MSQVPRSMGRCGGAGGKGANNAPGKGSGKGRGFGALPKWGKGGGFEASEGSSSQKETLAVLMKNNRLQEKMLAAFEKFQGTRPKQEPKKGKDTWNCTHCKAEKCFATRVECYKCGKPRVPNPPGLGAKTAAVKQAVKVEAAAAPMEVEVIEDVTLEKTIAEVEENMKLLRGTESVWAKSQKQDLEGQLKELKEQ